MNMIELFSLTIVVLCIVLTVLLFKMHIQLQRQVIGPRTLADMIMTQCSEANLNETRMRSMSDAISALERDVQSQFGETTEAFGACFELAKEQAIIQLKFNALCERVGHSSLKFEHLATDTSIFNTKTNNDETTNV
jgi:hypothetical protein